MKLVCWLISLIVLSGTIFGASEGMAAHPDVALRDADGNLIQPGSNIPYSPKQTCGTSQCHDTIASRYGLNNIYEHGVLYAQKDHGSGSPSYTNPYSVLYPEHGITSGFHFQQGRDVPWGDTENILRCPVIH
ncbi:MAG: hypothetical protein N2257_02040 [Thermodesulfovibrionales bacterium]|nr:hypothetical protein [Thermodesulfovibrionales bacterium]